MSLLRANLNTITSLFKSGSAVVYKEDVIGLRKIDSPEFVDVYLSSLRDEDSYLETLYAWLQEIFGVLLPMSIKDHIVALWTRIKGLEGYSEGVEERFTEVFETLSDVNETLFAQWENIEVIEGDIVNINNSVAILNAEQDAQWDAIRASQGASIAIQASPVPQEVPIVETPISWSLFKASTDEDRIDFAMNRLQVKRAGRYFFTSNMIVTKTVGVVRIITLTVRIYEEGVPLDNLVVVSPYPRTIELEQGAGTHALPSTTIMVDIAAPCELVLTAYADGSNVSFERLETDFYTSVGGGSGLWKQNAVAELFEASDVDMQDRAILNAENVHVPELEQEETYDAATLAYINALFGSLTDGVKDNIIRTWIALEGQKVKVPVTASDSSVVEGDRLQDVAEKLLWLQENPPSGGDVPVSWGRYF